VAREGKRLVDGEQLKQRHVESATAADGQTRSRKRTKKCSQVRGKSGQDGAQMGSHPVATPAAGDDAKKKRLLNKLKRRPKSAVRGEMPEILLTMVDKAKDGSLSHAKLLMDFADAPEETDSSGGAALSELLLARLEGKDVAELMPSAPTGKKNRKR
jgi:hypothetical protein